MKNVWAFVCRSSAIDQETNAISLFHILEDIQIPSTALQEVEDGSRPLAMGSFQVIVAVSRDDLDAGERSRARIRLHFPDESPPETLAEFDIDLTTSDRFRLRLEMPALPLGGIGLYRFGIEELSEEPDTWESVNCVTLNLSYVTGQPDIDGRRGD